MAEEKYHLFANLLFYPKGGIEDYKASYETEIEAVEACLLYTSPSPRDQRGSRMPSSA